MAPKDKRTTRASTAAAAAAQNTNINDDDNNDIPRDNDVEIVENRKKRKIDEPIEPPKIKLNLEMKNPIPPYVFYPGWARSMSVWINSSIRRKHTKDYEYVFMTMFGTMEGRVQQFAADYLGDHGYPNNYNDLEQFLLAMAAHIQGNSVMWDHVHAGVHAYCTGNVHAYDRCL